MAVIGIAFSAIAPLVLPFVSFAFALYWLAYRYNVLYVYRYDHESGGSFFLAALNQLFAGLYVMEVCLIGHFFVTVGDDGRLACVPHGIAMTAVLALTAAHQVFTNRTFHTLTKYLPVCEDVSGDVLASKQSWSGDECESGERSNEGATDLSVVSKQPGESTTPRDSSHEKVRVARCQPPATSNRYPSIEEKGSSSGKTGESARGAVWWHGSAPKPIVWIPRDGYGVSTDEMRSTVEGADSIQISDDGAWLDDEGKVRLDTCPPDQNMPTFSRFNPSGSFKKRNANETIRER
jgi:hypothetical protein